MNKILIKISDKRLWILNYNFVCALFFIPITAYSSLKIRKIRIARKKSWNESVGLKNLKNYIES